ncbi:ANK_REP_REGION domain-containing protein [Trichoderma simmonsii]|uniref:ANK_REP_REGION domain-containing protein n=1 Tax=Trichoderma simmonsii TaxID=1491479 RepID=A0A8G0L874_9HYPO|nr:ANK_REP_REGION domain-containing protein [Trichoderma simmonsii]
MESLAAAGLATMKQFKFLQDVELESVENQSKKWPKNLFLAQFDRFELWAVNLGVFVKGHGSLDYRIRDSENMKEAILKMMKNLNRSLDEALAYLRGDIEQEDEDSDTDSSSEMESDMDLLLDSIKDPIDRLYKMAVWIRNPATRITSTKARNLQQVDEETNVDLFKSFEKFDYEHISSLFLEYEKNKAIQETPIVKPHDTVGNDKALVEDQVWEPIRKTLELNRMRLSNGDESYLVRRIARANGLRRQQFAYWRKHKNKLREHAAVVVEVPTHNLPTTSHIIQLEDKNEKAKAPLTVTTATQLRLSHETGKELEKENVMTLAVSEYAPSAWNPSKDIVSFPSPPKASPVDEFFECPYCYTICPASILSEKAWRAHIIRDLRPYICTFENCSNSEQLYDSRDDWIEHETSTHQTVFRCPMHEEETFTTLATYDEHTQTYHKEEAMPSSFATSTATNIHRSCPICSIVLGTVQKLQSHIALHLERFAMFTLPRCTDDSDEGVSSGRSASAHVDSNRSLAGDIDTESNATGNSQHDSILSSGIQFDDQAQTQTQIGIEQSRAMISLHDAAAQGSLTTLDPYKSSSIHFDVDEIDRKGRTALAYAALKGHIDVVKLLLSENAKVNHTDDKNRTALWYASLSHSSVPQQRRHEVIEYLLLKGADPDVQAKDGSTALMKLIEHRDSGAIRLLTQKGASTTVVVEKREMSVYEVLTGVRHMSKRIAALHSPDGIVSSDEERLFFEEMEEIKSQLKNYGRIVRVWPPGGTTNTALLELGDTCIGAGLIDEATEALELLKFLQVSVFEYNDRGLLPTQQLLARAYEVNEALREVDKQLGQGANLHIEPNKSKALDIFARTEAGMKHAQTIWGPNIWNFQQIRQDTVDKIQQESYAQAQQFPVPMDLYQEDPEPSEESDVQEGIDLAGHNVQDSNRADDDRRVPMDPPEITDLAERYYEKLHQLQTDHQQTNDDESNATTTATASEFILPLRDSSSPTDEKPKPSARGKKSFLSLRQKAAAHATHRLSSVDIIAEQEKAGIPYLWKKEDNEIRGGGHNIEGEIVVLREMFKVLVEESQAEFEQAAEGTELKLEAQTLARTLAQQTTLYMLDVQELKIQYFEATNILEREKGSAFVDKIRSYDFGGMRDMIKEIQKKREAEEARRAEAARERNEKQAESEKRLLLKIEEANKELIEHEERKERHKQALEAINAKRGLKDSSAAPPELEARDASTEVLATETSKSELNAYEEEISAEDEKIRDAIEKLIALQQELRRVQAEKEVQVPSGSESQKAQSRRSETTWQCCQCGMGGHLFNVDYYCTEHDCRHPFCHNCLINFD